MLVSEGDPLTSSIHEYTVSPLLDTLGGVRFQLVFGELPSVITEVVALYVEAVGLAGEAPLLATTSE